VLDSGHQNETLGAKIAALRCDVVLPALLQNGFEKFGLLDTTGSEARRFPRFRIRGLQRRAGLLLRPSLPDLPREETWRGVYTTTLSRNGLGFLHTEQLFPCEQLQVLLPCGHAGLVEIAWCRRLAQRCFEVGARFTQELTAPQIRAAAAAFE